MESQEIILQQLQALSLGPTWTEKQYDTKSGNQVVKKEQDNSAQKDVHFYRQLLSRCKERIKVDFRPNVLAMNTLIQTLRKSYITYHFIPLVRLFLEKENRLNIIIHALEGHSIFCLRPNKLPFLTLGAAQDYLVKKYWNEVFESREVHLEPPQGVFTSVNFCGMTGVLLGPPNYHLYSDLLREHYEDQLKDRCTWDEFLASIRNTHDEKDVQQWMKKMTCNYHYYLKEDPSICFENSRLAKAYLLQHLPKQESIMRLKQLCFSYDQVHNVVDEDLRLFLESEGRIEMQLPIRLTNFCRTRLHRIGFHIYRKGNDTKCATYVCSVKRNIRDENTCFSPELLSIIDCIEAHPCASLDKILKVYFCAQSNMSIDQQVDFEQIAKFKQNLILLVRQGYVTQYEDGTLYISPRQTMASKQNQRRH